MPRVSLLSTGCFSLNEAAFALLGRPAAVVLLYDRTQQAIGLKPAPAGATHAARVRQPKPKDQYYIIAARDFLSYYRIPYDRLQVWEPIQHDGALVLELGTAQSAKDGAVPSAPALATA